MANSTDGHSTPRPGRGIPTRSARRRLAAVLAGIGLLALTLAPAGAVAAVPLSISTPYPAVSVAPGSKVSFDLTVTADQKRQVALAVSGIPTGWTATLHGGGFVINGVTAGPSGTPPAVRLDVSVPADATSTTAHLAVSASSGSLSDRLDLAIDVSAQAAGSVTMTSDFPKLQGPASGSFKFSLTLNNNTAQDLTFALSATGASGWTVTATPTSQSQASTTTVNAGSTASIDVNANPPSGVTAGDYPLEVTATGGSQTVKQDLVVTITGDYKLTLTTPDGQLNAHGPAGGEITRTLSVQDDGSAPLTAVKLTSTPPTGWKVTFQPSDTIDQVVPGTPSQVTAVITPSGDAVAGDYIVTFNASGNGAGGQAAAATGTVDIRTTVETSAIWGLVGVVIILAVLGGLAWVFRTYGRR